MKKILALVLVTAFAATMISSCSGTEATLLDFLGDQNEKLDLSGKKITFLGETDKDSELGFIDEAFIKTNTAMHDAVLTRIAEIEKKYNCELVYDCFSEDSDTYIDRVTNLIATGETPADFLYGHGNSKLQNFADAGYLYPLTELKDYIDYEDSKKFGTAGILEGAMVNGVPYAVQPVQWLGYENNFCFFLVYNPSILMIQGQPNLHEYYENEKWTWDVFENIIANYDKGGKETNYAFTAAARAVAQLALLSNGIKYVDYIDGEFVTDFASDSAIYALEWMQHLYKDYAENVFEVDYWDVTDFNQGNSMMTVGTGQQAISGKLQYDDENVEFSIMPFPCGPDGKYGEWAQWSEAIRGFAIPSNHEDPHVPAMIINDLCEPFEDFGGSGGVKDYLNSMVFFDPLDTEILLECGQYIRYLYCQSDYTLNDIAFAAGDNYDTKTAREIIESNESKIMDLIENEIKPNYVNYIHDHLYGE